MKKTIRMNLQGFNIRSLDSLEAWLRQQISRIGGQRKIDAANIRLARFENCSPAYHVSMHLVAPGPDVFAESRDHTLRAALMKAVDKVRQTFAQRSQKRISRLKGRMSLRMAH